MTNVNKLDFTDQEFSSYKDLINAKTGIVIKDNKKEMVYNRIMQRIRTLNLNSFEEYKGLLNNNTNDEMMNFVNVVTTNFTNFFRENHHFDFLLSQGFDEMLKANGGNKLRLWSAACSTGQEPYTLAITLDKFLKRKPKASGDILATDIDTSVLDAAKLGVYDLSKIQDMGDDILSNYFLKGSGSTEGRAKIKKNIQQYITFKQLNFMESWPPMDSFDMIICRNAMIYFDKATQDKLIGRFTNKLKPNGFLIIGHSETLCSHDNKFSQIDKTTYRKVG